MVNKVISTALCLILTSTVIGCSSGKTTTTTETVSPAIQFERTLNVVRDGKYQEAKQTLDSIKRDEFSSEDKQFAYAVDKFVAWKLDNNGSDRALGVGAAVELFQVIYRNQNNLNKEFLEYAYGQFDQNMKNEAFDNIHFSGKPQIGMSERQVVRTDWGRPTKINRTTRASGESSQWVYDNDRYAYFDNHYLTTIRE